MHIACHNADCPNAYAPFTAATDDPVPCPACGNPMQAADLEAIQALAEQKTAADIAAVEAAPPQIDIEALRAARAGYVRGLLEETDRWCARHIEDGVSLTPERVAYRKQLRTLLGSVAASADPTSIAIPDPPPPPKT